MKVTNPGDFRVLNAIISEVNFDLAPCLLLFAVKCHSDLHFRSLGVSVHLFNNYSIEETLRHCIHSVTENIYSPMIHFIIFLVQSKA